MGKLEQKNEANYVPIDVIDDLKEMSNKHLTINGCYVIPKSVLDLYIEYLENNRKTTE